jgi:hypothetical protein
MNTATNTQASSLVEVVRGDIFTTPCQTLTNPVNCQGVMGAGLAYAFRARYPDMYTFYRGLCDQRQLIVGQPVLRDDNRGNRVLLFPTKDQWRERSQLSWVLEGIDWIGECAQGWQLQSLAVPALGCGLGGLDWDRVGGQIRERLETVGVPVTLYAPGNPRTTLCFA